MRSQVTQIKNDVQNLQQLPCRDTSVLPAVTEAQIPAHLPLLSSEVIVNRSIEERHESRRMGASATLAGSYEIENGVPRKMTIPRLESRTGLDETESGKGIPRGSSHLLAAERRLPGDHRRSASPLIVWQSIRTGKYREGFREKAAGPSCRDVKAMRRASGFMPSASAK